MLRMNRLIIADLKSAVVAGGQLGHFFSVASNYYRLFSDKILTKVAGGPIYATRFGNDLLPLPYDQEQLNKKKVRSLWYYFCNVRVLFNQCEKDVIVVQQGADVTFFVACALFYRKRQNKLYLIQYSTASLEGSLKRKLYGLVKHKIDGIICPNNEIGEAFGIPYCVVPDYIYTGNDMEIENIPYENRQYDICLLGHISEEKGVIQFLELFADIAYKILVAGLPANELIADRLIALTKGLKNITVQLDYLSDEIYKKYLHQSRFCVLNYQGEYSRRSSGVVLDMIFNDVPIIGMDCKALEFVKQYKLGYVYNDLKSLDLSAIITKGMYDAYVNNIHHYKQTHFAYRQKLGNFLNIYK